MLDANDTHSIELTIAELRAAYGASLDAVVLWGEAATEAYVAARSPLSLAIVVESVTPVELRAGTRLAPAMRRRRIDSLFFDRDYLASARDVFPLELLDLSDRHRVLDGADPFADVQLDLSHLRIEVEQQLRGKMLHLWDEYMSAAGRARPLAQLLLDSPPGFQIIGRGMLRLRDVPRPPTPDPLLAAVERTFSLQLPTLRRLSQARAERRSLPRTELESFFSGYNDEVRALVAAADRL